MFSSATQPTPPRPPPCHNFVVSAITFEGFKLRSSNLTHALLIQISRTSAIIDIVVPSKMAAGGHFVKNVNKKKFLIDLICPKVPDRSEMDRNAIESDFRTSKMAAEKQKVPYLSEMARNAIESEFRTSKMADRSEMARNAIKSVYGHPKWLFWQKFKNKKKFRIDLKWPEMRSNVIFGHPKWPPMAMLMAML